MSAETYDVQTDIKTHRNVDAEQIRRYIHANVLRVSDRVRNSVTGHECLLGQHPEFAPLFDSNGAGDSVAQRPMGADESRVRRDRHRGSNAQTENVGLDSESTDAWNSRRSDELGPRGKRRKPTARSSTGRHQTHEAKKKSDAAEIPFPPRSQQASADEATEITGPPSRPRSSESNSHQGEPHGRLSGELPPIKKRREKTPPGAPPLPLKIKEGSDSRLDNQGLPRSGSGRQGSSKKMEIGIDESGSPSREAQDVKSTATVGPVPPEAQQDADSESGTPASEQERANPPAKGTQGLRDSAPSSGEQEPIAAPPSEERENSNDERTPRDEPEGLSPAHGEERISGSRRRGIILASIFIPGAGQLLLGEWKRGCLFFLLALLTLYGVGIAGIVAGVDAYFATSRGGREPRWPVIFGDGSGGRSSFGARDFGWVVAWVAGAGAMWFLVLGGFSSGNDKQPSTDQVAASVPDAVVEEPQTECENRHERCEIDGVVGRCLRGGWCMPLGPGCIHDVDCEDGNACTMDSCVGGECKLVPVDQRCVLEDESDGVCRRGICESKLNGTCLDDSDCPSSDNACATIGCSAKGRCELSEGAGGQRCSTATGAPGTCSDGTCEIDRVSAAERWDINCRTVRGYYGRRYQKCDKSLRFILSEEELNDVRRTIRERISKEMRYDVLVSLIELPDGGYNIVTTNLRSRDRVQGLMDPSFIAFTMAGYTKETGWKSRQLQTWVTPYEEGWAIPTSGSRVAIEKGRSKSILGAYGVIDIEEYRSWLQKNFYKLPDVEMLRRGESTGVGENNHGEAAPIPADVAEKEETGRTPFSGIRWGMSKSDVVTALGRTDYRESKVEISVDVEWLGFPMRRDFIFDVDSERLYTIGHRVKEISERPPDVSDAVFRRWLQPGVVWDHFTKVQRELERGHRPFEDESLNFTSFPDDEIRKNVKLSAFKTHDYVRQMVHHGDDYVIRHVLSMSAPFPGSGTSPKPLETILVHPPDDSRMYNDLKRVWERGSE